MAHSSLEGAARTGRAFERSRPHPPPRHRAPRGRLGGVRALAKTHPSAGLELIDAPEPDPGPTDVKIRVFRAGLCGTDLHLEQWDDWAAGIVHPPLIIGHEFFGEVVQIGDAVTS